eukprot:GFUD01130381.1.p1 GENE.GFUD01130381.1~~GFUD01130381.1.p1  ORF type:complete len:481 (-),score=90.13 GFUD01130381.1:442-1884(-)
MSSGQVSNVSSLSGPNDQVANVQSGTPLPKMSYDMSLHDSGFISPPTLVKYDTETPCHYFLRGQARWSSTPLPVPESLTTPLFKSSSSPSIPTTSTPHNIEVIDFQKRLDNFVHDDDHSSQESDSGFESLINSTAENSEGEASLSHWALREGKRANFAHMGGLYCKDEESSSRLGAIPKRRSPRQLAMGNKIDGIERLTMIKTGKRNLNIDQEDDKIIAESKSSFSVPDFEKFNSRKNLLKFPNHASKEGRETCDIVRHLYERNISHVLGSIYKCLSPKDLCKVAQVSQLWNLSLASLKFHDERRTNFVAIMRIDRENFGVKLALRSKLVSPRRVMREVANINFLSPNSGKRDRNPSSSAIISPSKIRHKLFLDEARKLSPGERLVQCPVCTSPSRVSLALNLSQTSSQTSSSQAFSSPNVQNFQKAQCSSPKCNFVFCPHCQCEDHSGRSCRVTRTGSSKVPKSGAVTSKKSKARLRRL